MIFSGISWKAYSVAVITLLILYCLFIGIRYYRKEILDFLTGRRISNKREPSDSSPVKKNNPGKEAEYLFARTKELAERIKDTIKMAHAQDYPKYQLLSLIKSLVAEYLDLKSVAIIRAVNNAIISESSKYEVYNFKEEELGELWDE